MASPSGPLPSLFKLCPWGQEWSSPVGHMFNRYLYRKKHEKIFLSKTVRPRVLILGMKHHLMDLYQVCSNYAPWANNCPTTGVSCLTLAYRGKTWKNLLVWNHKAYSLDILYVASPSRPLPSLFKLCPWGQKWLRLGGHMFYIGLYREKHEKISFSETIGPRALIFGV